MDFNDYGGFAGSMAGLGLGNLFSDWKNPADAAMGDVNKIPGMMSPYYQNYIDQGKNAFDPASAEYSKLVGNLPGLQNQFQNMINDPMALYNKVASGYQQSPGFKFAMQQALQGANHKNAAGGMYGSPQNVQQNMQLASDIASQDYGNYMDRALGSASGMLGAGLSGQEGLYGKGLEGLGRMGEMKYGTGFNASQDLATNIAQSMMAKALLGYQGQAAENQNQGGGLGSLLGGLGGLIGGGGLSAFKGLFS